MYDTGNQFGKHGFAGAGNAGEYENKRFFAVPGAVVKLADVQDVLQITKDVLLPHKKVLYFGNFSRKWRNQVLLRLPAKDATMQIELMVQNEFKTRVSRVVDQLFSRDVKHWQAAS
jgi:hypothetical protein